jgi:hypothetical protein
MQPSSWAPGIENPSPRAPKRTARIFRFDKGASHLNMLSGILPSKKAHFAIQVIASDVSNDDERMAATPKNLTGDKFSFFLRLCPRRGGARSC